MKLKFLCTVFCLAMTLNVLTGAEKPNIVLINVDDLGWAELGAYGQEKIKTPNIDKLAEQGQRWTQFYSGAPVCSPSRNVLMTGQHTGHTDVQDLKRVQPNESWTDLKGDWPISKEAYTIPEALKKAGYTTGAFGKWGLGEYGTTGAPDKHGIDTFYGYTDHKACHSYYPPFLWDNDQKHIINDPPIPGHLPRVNEGEVNADDYRGENHASELIALRAVNFILKEGRGKKPFFLYYAPCEPHVAMQPLQRWVDHYPKEWDNKPYRGGGYLPHPRPRAGYAGMISQMDYNVGRIMEALQKTGADKNTLIIFTSDNGTTHDVGGVDHKFFNSVKGLRGLKGQLFEGGIRVPGIFCWPGKIKPGTVIDQPAYHADIMPTLCAIAKAGSGKPDGIDLSSILSGKSKSIANRKPMVWAGGGYEGQVAVRIGDLKAVRRNLDPGKKEPGNWLVFDIAKDPEEKNNIAATERKMVEKATGILDKEYRAAKGYPRLRYDAPEKDIEADKNKS